MPGAIGEGRGVDLNRANEQDLAQVGGIGPEQAQNTSAQITQEPRPHRAGQSSGGESKSDQNQRQESAGSGSGDLNEREYSDEQVHHHTRTYEEQHSRSKKK